ncbi:MAG: 2-oxo-4-hydroxy-4-carboxy-5-ureidoimidazoline decarboxylase [Puniceicoccaceae bacterium]|nr:MAG: 2-oxo-4-hydroxy-4-carboxy-5-ureidoimidazoline decarboxylase [Puniceicoccaceae bacterium]
MSAVSLHQLNKFDNVKYCSALKGVYEHSPWVIQKTFNDRPFNTVKELHDTCVSLINGASHDTQLSLIRAHPDLAAKLEQLPRLTRFSQEEQSKAGFSSLPLVVIDQLRNELVRYRQLFGHPFILCLAENSAIDVLPILKERMQSDLNTERTACLFQITRIGWHRLCSIIDLAHL